MTNDPQTYFSRIEQYRNWYDQKAVWAKNRYMQTKISSAISAVLIPVISNTDKLPLIGDVSGYKNILVTFLGLYVALLIALENVLKYKDQWINYRSTEQYIVREKILFEAKSGPYEALDDVACYHRFIGVCEDAIQNENQATLNILTRDETTNKVKSE